MAGIPEEFRNHRHITQLSFNQPPAVTRQHFFRLSRLAPAVRGGGAASGSAPGRAARCGPSTPRTAGAQSHRRLRSS